MRITADTNVLLRVVVPGDETQQEIAIETLKNAESVAISIQALCELAWVMERMSTPVGFQASGAE